MKRKFLTNIILSSILILLTSVLSIISPLLQQNAIDNGISSKNYNVFFVYVILLLSISIIQVICNYSGSIISFCAGKQYVIKKYNRAVTNLFLKPTNFFTDNSNGYINARINEINEFSDLFSPTTFALFGSLIQFIVAIIIIFYTNWKITLVIIAMIPICIALVIIFRKKINAKTDNMYESLADLDRKMIESLSGINDIKLFSQERRVSSNIQTIHLNSILNEKEFRKLTLLNSSISSFLLKLASLVVLLGCGIYIIKGTMSFGQYVAFANYSELVLSPIIVFTNFAQTLLPMSTLYKRSEEFNDQLLSDSEFSNDTLINGTINSIKAENIKFSYIENSTVISNLSFEVSKGDILLIKGKNGSGKSTLIYLLLKFYNLTGGDVIYNTTSIEGVSSRGILQHVAVLPQHPFIFNESIKSNIEMGSDIDPSEYKNVLLTTNLNEFIDGLEESDRTVISENGVNISGGQVKKIGLARALAKKSEILILDEPFPHLDKSSIEDILQAIKIVKKDKIVIIVDHTDNADSLATKTILL